MKHAHYKKDVRHLKFIDAYRVCELFEVDSQPVGHAIKKLLCAGGRGAKDYEQDLREAVDSIHRALQMKAEDRDAQPQPAKPARAEELQADYDSLAQGFRDIAERCAKVKFDGRQYTWPTGGMLPQEPADDGWVEWRGGKCPVGDRTMVLVRTSSLNQFGPVEAWKVSWDEHSLITHYRPAKEQA